MLDLRWTEMGVEGAKALTLAFENMACPKLERLKMMEGPSAWTMEMRSAMDQVRDLNPDTRPSPNPSPNRKRIRQAITKRSTRELLCSSPDPEPSADPYP